MNSESALFSRIKKKLFGKTCVLCGFVLEKDAIQSVIIVNKFMPEHSAAVELAAKNAADALILDVREVVKQGQKPS